MQHKVCITGMGAVSPIGHSAEQSFQAAVNGVLGIDYATIFDRERTGIHVAGEVKNLDMTGYITGREAKRMARFTQFAIVAALQAWNQSKMESSGFDPLRVGVIMGSGMGGIDIICEQHSELIHNGPRSVSALFIPKAIINTTPGLIAMRLNLHGPCYSVVTACASGSDALGQAYYAIKEGRMDAVLVGGAEAAITELSVQGFHQMTALTESDDPKRACIPFDKDRQGFVMAEGAGFMLLESEEHAKARCAEVLAQFAGYAQTCDAYHITSPIPEGLYAAEAMRLALEDAGIQPEDIGYINAHGTGTPPNDSSESLAIERCFKEHAKHLLVSSTKSMTGHMLGAAGAFEAIIAAYAANSGTAPPTIGLENEGENCRLDYVKGKAKQFDKAYAMSNAFGFGGHNSSLIIKRG